jgi:outer membrane protein assembly factor BamB
VSGAGYALWFGVDDGQLLGAFLRESQLHIVAVDPDPAKINALRLTFAAAGTYGHRIVLHVGDPIRFKAPPYIANLVVVGESLATHLSEPRVLQAAYESVRPYGGRLWIQADKARSEALVNEIAAANLPQAKIYVEAGGVAIIREGALAGSADWTHQYGNVANTVKSDDRRVKLPLGLLWFGGNTHNDVLPRHGHGPSEQVIDGRLFIEGMDCLSARDVYTGRVLWKREFAELGNFGIYFDESYTNVPLSTVYGQKHIPGANARGANFVATSEAIYLLATNKCLVLDPATGKLLRKIEASFGSPSEATRWAYIGVCEDVLLAGIDFANYTRQFALWPTNNPSASNRPPTAVDLSASRALVGFDRHTGEVLWRQEAHHSFVHNAIVAGNGRVFCIDRLPNSARDKLKRRGRPAPKDFRLAAYNLHNGHLLWETTNNVIGTWLSYSGQHDVLLQAGASATDRLKDEAEQGMIAYNGKTGAILWSNLAVKYTGPCILHDDVILTTPTSYKTNAGAFGLLDGLPRGLRNPLTGQLEPLRIYRTYGCNYPVACENLLTFRSGAAGFFDLLNYSGSGNFGGFKSGCSPNLIAANGVLNAPDYTRTCTCPYQNQTSLAFVHWPGDELEYWTHNQFGVDTKEGIRIRRVGINFGAPGDRLERTGTLWLEHPSVGGSSPNLLVTVKGSKTNFFCRSSIAFGGEGPAWVMASGVTGIERVIIAPETRKKLPPPPAPKKKTGDDIEDKDEAEPEKNGNSQTNGVSSTASSTASITKTNPLPVELTNALTKAASTNKVEPPFVSTLTAAPYTVRLYFAEPEDLAPGLRVFDVELQGRLVLPAFDVVKAAGGVRRGIIKEFHGVTVEHDLTIKFTRAKGQTNGPLLNGVEMILEESAN